MLRVRILPGEDGSKYGKVNSFPVKGWSSHGMPVQKKEDGEICAIEGKEGKAPYLESWIRNRGDNGKAPGVRECSITRHGPVQGI